MTRPLLAALGLALLAACVALSEAPAPAAGGSLEALGRSLGGWRVLAVDALFFRAESLRAQGRTEELPALYQTLVALDPDNDAAVDALAHEQVANLLPTAPTPEARLGWWREAWRLTLRGLGAHPGSPRLLFRAADLALEVPVRRPDLAPALDREFGSVAAREAQGLAWLVACARSTPHLPTMGRLHLVRLARAAPLLAVHALARGQPVEQAAALLSPAADLAARYPEALREVQEEVVEPPTPGVAPRRVPLARALDDSIAVVRAALAATRGERGAGFDAAFAAYRETAGETPLALALRAWLLQR